MATFFQCVENPLKKFLSIQQSLVIHEIAQFNDISPAFVRHPILRLLFLTQTYNNGTKMKVNRVRMRATQWAAEEEEIWVIHIPSWPLLLSSWMTPIQDLSFSDSRPFYKCVFLFSRVVRFLFTASFFLPQIITLECPTALVWNYLGENKTPSSLIGSPLDLLPNCSPSGLPMPPRQNNQAIRHKLKQAEIVIKERSAAAEGKYEIGNDSQPDRHAIFMPFSCYFQPNGPTSAFLDLAMR